jgi:type II secretory pathway predicted ATPase ExeA/cell division septation protein DedD
MLRQDSATDPSTLTYERHFGLREKAFSLSADPRFFFQDGSRAAAFSDLLTGIRRREGILTLTGPIGSGKTTLCRTVLESLDRKTFSAFVPDPILTREDLLKSLLVDFGIVSIEEIRAGHLRGIGRTELTYPLREFLVSLQPLHAFAVLIIDEAQNLPNALLEEIRILSELEQGTKLLQLVLVGQPEFETKLAEPEMCQLQQRVSVRCKLGPLATADVGSYIAHRLTIAGGRDALFAEDAIPLIAAASGGIPRIINLLCDRALTRAAVDTAPRVSAKHLISAAGDLKLPLFNVGTLWWETETAGATAPAVQSQKTDDHPDATLTPIAERSVPALETFGLSPQRRGSRLRPIGALALLAVVTAGATYLIFRPDVTPVTSPSATDADRRPPDPAPASREATPAAPAPPQSAPSSSSAATGTAARSSAVGAASPEGNAARVGAYRVQIATFRTASRAEEAVKVFQEAGFRARSSEVLLRDGNTAFSVQLGPYADRDAAETDIKRAGAVPGYGPGVIVEPKPRVN